MKQHLCICGASTVYLQNFDVFYEFMICLIYYCKHDALHTCVFKGDNIFISLGNGFKFY